MKGLQRFLLSSLIITIPALTWAFSTDEPRARYTVTSWTERDGIPSSYVRAVTQDRDGYLWIATYSGLVRFDGARFARWKSKDGSTLPSDDLYALLIARDGSLWVAGFGSVTRIVDGRIDKSASPETGFFSGYVSALLQDGEGHIWAASQSGVARFDGVRWERFGSGHGLPERAGLRLLQDPAGNLWIGTSAGLYRRTPDGVRFEPIPELRFAIEDIALDDTGGVVVPHPTGLFSSLSGTLPRPVDPDLQRSHGTRLLRDREGYLWIGTRGQGLARLRAGHNTNAVVFDRVTTESGLSADSVQALFEDREGNIWVGTPYGLNRLSRNSIVPVPLGSDATGHVRAVAEGDGGMFVATDEGLLHFAGGRQLDYEWKRKLPNHTLIALHHDKRSNTLWISTNQGLVRLKSGVLSEFPTPGSDGVLNRIRSITIDDRGRLWLCDVDRGVYRSTDDKLMSFTPVAQDKTAATILATRNRRVWVGFVDGTVRSYLDERAESFSEEHGLPGGGTVSAIHEDRNGVVWVGTHRGLSRFANGRFLTLSSAEGLPGPGPVSIIDDAQGQLWLGITGLGILQISAGEFETAASSRGRHRLRYRLYGPAEGLRGTPVRTFGTPTVTRGLDGVMWFLTGNGLALVDPLRVTAQRKTAPLVIESMVADEQEHTPGDDLHLPPHTSTLQFDYTLLSLTPLSQAAFRYKLEGFDEHWVEAGSRRQAFYTNVGPGSYRFVVEFIGAESSDHASAEWRFSIRPRFYQTMWFGFAAAFGVGLWVWGLWQLRLHQMRQRFAMVLEERARMGREIHDTLLQGLVGVAVQFKVIADQLQASPDAARERLDRLRKLVEHYITETRQSIWDLRSPVLTAGNLVTALREAGHALTADKEVRFDLVVRGKPYPCPPQVEEQLLRVGREAVSNAVRHAFANRIKAELAYQRDSVSLRVTDDGRGFDPSDPGFTAGTHWGLTSMRERAQQINARFRLDSSPGKGTRLELVVPAVQAR